MLLIRRFEEKSAEAYVAGKIGGFCHLYIGQEAVGVGTISAIAKTTTCSPVIANTVSRSPRDVGRAIMAELFGKATGCSKGKGGSMHMFDKSLGFLGGHAIVGGQIPLATGTLSHEIPGHGSSDALLLRRSSSEPGRFPRIAEHGPALETSLHLHLRKQPVRHGHFARPRDVAAEHRAESLRLRMASEFVDGMDVLAVREATLRAVERARKDYLPTLLEIRTYRFMGHSMSDPATIARAPRSRSIRNAIRSSSSRQPARRKDRRQKGSTRSTESA
jgi:pyruvate dehydrogenase E1 component alpha subunit